MIEINLLVTKKYFTYDMYLSWNASYMNELLFSIITKPVTELPINVNLLTLQSYNLSSMNNLPNGLYKIYQVFVKDIEPFRIYNNALSALKATIYNTYGYIRYTNYVYDTLLKHINDKNLSKYMNYLINFKIGRDELNQYLQKYINTEQKIIDYVNSNPYIELKADNIRIENCCILKY